MQHIIGAVHIWRSYLFLKTFNPPPTCHFVIFDCLVLSLPSFLDSSFSKICQKNILVGTKNICREQERKTICYKKKMIDIKQSYLTLLNRNTGRPTVTLVTFIFPGAEKLKGNPGLFLKLQTSQPSKNLGLNHICIDLFGLKRLLHIFILEIFSISIQRYSLKLKITWHLGT